MAHSPAPIIITLPPERWREYRALRLEALQLFPAAYGARYNDVIAQPDTYWIEQLLPQTDPVCCTLFCEIQGALVGMVRSARSQDDVKVVMLSRVYMQPKFQGSCCASVLFEELFRRLAICQDVASIIAIVNPTEGRAVGFYQKMGFSYVREAYDARSDCTEWYMLRSNGI